MIEEDLTKVIDSALSFALANLHTITVCKVMEVGAKTISCQPVINRVDEGESKPLPTFTEVPPIFLGNRSDPIAAGDYCLMLFSERCYDSWFYGDDFVSPLELRMHDYSDGFALVGIRNNEQAINIPDVSTQDGDMVMEGNLELTGDITQTGNTTQKGDITQTGNQNITGNVIATTVQPKNGLTVVVPYMKTPVTPGAMTFVSGILTAVS